MSDRLSDYRAKRRAGATPEPGVETTERRRARTAAKDPRFVIQKHDATACTTTSGSRSTATLRSWAVPKGPLHRPAREAPGRAGGGPPAGLRRLRGRDRRGNYGAGAVIVWDTGTYANLDRGPVDGRGASSRARLRFWLDGREAERRLDAAAHAGGDKPQWLLIKRRDEGADARRNPVSTQPESVKRAHDRAGREDAMSDR